MKLHIAVGDIYLSGFCNIDIDGKLVSEVTKEQLEANKTTLDKYFKYPFGSPRREIIIDKRMDLLKKWDFKDKSVDEIVMISIIEHFLYKDAKFIISEIKRILKPKGKLIIDFPDIKQTVEQYIDNNPNFCMRLIYCNAKNKYSVHRWGYTKKTIKDLLGKEWKSIKQKTIVKHCYPTISIEAIKD